MVDPVNDGGSGDGPLGERPPMVVGYDPSRDESSSFFDRLPTVRGTALAQRLLRTPIHREVSVLVGAGAILLIGLALFLSQRSAAPGDELGQLSSEAEANEEGRSNGLFGGLFGGDDEQDDEDSEEGDRDAEDGETADRDTEQEEQQSDTEENAATTISDADDSGDTQDDSESNSGGTSTPSGTSSTSAPTDDQTTVTNPSTTEQTTAVTNPSTSLTRPAVASSTASTSRPTAPPTIAPTAPSTIGTTQPPSTLPPPPANAGTPYRSHQLPGRIQAEFYDKGGQGEGYNDMDPENDGEALRLSQGVDLYETNGGDIYVRRTRTGEWLQYTITVPESGQYFAEVSVSSGNADPGAIVMLIDGDRFARFDVQPTGSSGNWVRLTSNVEPLTAGVHVVRLNIIDGGNFGLDWFSLQAAG